VVCDGVAGEVTLLFVMGLRARLRNFRLSSCSMTGRISAQESSKLPGTCRYHRDMTL